ncbi:MAG: hypothetical protein P1U32_00940 [Legionellaceae bacterium]|nr:hypothetical protein [Legionellaceae bacterium]
MPQSSNTQYPHDKPDTITVIQEQRFEVLRPYIQHLCEHPEEPDACAHTFIQLMANSNIPGDILCQLLEHFKLTKTSIQCLAHAPQLKKKVYAYLEGLDATSTHLTLLKKCTDKTTVIGQFFHEKTNKVDFWTKEPKTLQKIQALITKMEVTLEASKADTQALTLLVQTLSPDSEPRDTTPPNIPSHETVRPAAKASFSRSLLYLIAFIIIPVTYLLLSQTEEEAVTDQLTP